MKRLMLILILTAIPSAVWAWTAPLVVSEAGYDDSVPSIARGSGGAMHIAWRRKPDWRICYRYRAGNGAWGGTEVVSSQSWADRACVIEDPSGRPHVLYTASQASGKTDLYEAVEYGGAWTVTQFTSTVDYNEDYARLATDAIGRIHLVYTKSADGDHGDVIYRVWNGSWSGETSIGSVGSNGKVFYHRPDISVDSANNVHVVWEKDPYTLVYRKFGGSSWSAQTTLGTTSQFFSYAKIAAATSSNIVAVTFDQQDASTAVLKYAASTNGGASWSALQYMNDGHYPNMDAFGGNAHLIYEWPGANYVGYRMWNGSGWSAPVQISNYTRWQGWPDISVGTDGIVYGVYDDGDVYGSDTIRLVASADNDTAPPAQVSGLSATASDSTVHLAWTNPADPDYKGTTVRFKTTGYPTSPSDGTLLCDHQLGPGSADSVTHSGLTNGMTYYYRVFTYDMRGNYSAGVAASAVPTGMSCRYVKDLADSTVVDMQGKVVTAVFSSDGCVYVQEPDRSSAIRVSTNQAGLAVGDRVNVSGTMATRNLSGYRAERVVTATSVTRIAGGAVSPLGMGCGAVGGAAVGSVPGVRDAVGANSMGLLVRICGRVTKVIGNYAFVDDGAGVPNVSTAGDEVGVMVRCATTPTFAAGSIVSATGVLEGSIPSGWTANRRYLRCRDAADVVVRH